jgi:hypothetical protein
MNDAFAILPKGSCQHFRSASEERADLDDDLGPQRSDEGEQESP